MFLAIYLLNISCGILKILAGAEVPVHRNPQKTVRILFEGVFD